MLSNSQTILISKTAIDLWNFTVINFSLNVKINMIASFTGGLKFTDWWKKNVNNSSNYLYKNNLKVKQHEMVSIK